MHMCMRIRTYIHTHRAASAGNYHPALPAGPRSAACAHQEQNNWEPECATPCPGLVRGAENSEEPVPAVARPQAGVTCIWGLSGAGLGHGEGQYLCWSQMLQPTRAGWVYEGCGTPRPQSQGVKPLWGERARCRKLPL